MRSDISIQEALTTILTVLEEKYSIKLDDIPRSILQNILSEIQELKISREFLERYITQIVIPDLNRTYYENVRKYEKMLGWGQIERQIHFLIGKYLSKVGYSVHFKPIVNGVLVDLVLEQYGKYLPLILTTNRNDKVAYHRWSRLKSTGLNAYFLEIDRLSWKNNKLLNILDINDLEYYFHKHARYRINMRCNIYEETLYEIWRKYVDRGYLALRNHIEYSTVFDLFLVGFSKIGVKKIRKSATIMPTILSKTLKKISKLLRLNIIDRVILLTPTQVFDKVISEVRRQIPTKLSMNVSVRPI